MSITRRLAGTWFPIVVVVAGLCACAAPARLEHRELPRTATASPALVPAPVAQKADADHRDHAVTPGTDSPDAALQFRRLQQQDETGYVRPDGLINAKRHADQMRRFQAMTFGMTGRSAAGISPESWTWLGPGNVGGRVRSIVVNPVVPSTWFTGGVSGGIWKTVDSGARWEPVNDFLANLSISSMVIQPGNPSVMYAGTGEAVQLLQGAGIFRSADGGDTWAQLGATASDQTFNYVNRLAMSPDGSVLLAATIVGVYRSIDEGATFSLALDMRDNPAFYGAMYVAFNPASSSKAIASAFDGRGWYSNDGGLTWTESTGLPVVAGGSRRTELAYAPSNPAVVYASVDEAGGTIYKSTNGGVSYSFVSTGSNYLTPQGWYNNAIWVDPANPNRLVVGGVGLYRSADGGLTLSDIQGIAHSDFHAIVSLPGYNGGTNRQVLVGNDGGVYFSNDISAVPAAWVSKNNNLGLTQFYGAAGNESSGTIVGGTQDNGTLRYTTAGGPQDYIPMAGGDGGYAASDPNDPNYFYGEFQWLSVHRSSNGGASSTVFFGHAIPDHNGNSNFIAPFILDPNNSNTLLAGGRSLWRTTNAKFGNPPSFSSIKAPTDGFVSISAIAIAPGNSDICWAGHNNGDIYKAVDCTSASPTWTQVDTNGQGLPDRMVMRVTFDPSDPSGNRVYATFGGFSADNLWRTTNGGASWTSASGSGLASLPAVPVHDVEIYPGSVNLLYAATEIGVFTSEDAGATWQIPQDGPANVIVSELFWMGSDLVAATFGRGLFRATVVNGTYASLSSPSLSFGSQPLGTTSAPQTATLSNTGAAPLSIIGLGLVVGEFPIQSNTCAIGTSLPVGGSCTVTVRFSPGATGSRTGAITINTDAVNGQQQIDLTGTGTSAADFTPPTVTSVTPASGTKGVGVATAVTATFGEAINAGTLTTSTFVLRNAANAVVPAAVTYNAATRVGTLAASAGLAAATTYTATITGGGAGVKDVAGNPLASTVVWSFTTAGVVPLTLGSTTIGSSLDWGDSNFLNGSKVTTTAAGQVSSMSVYVGSIDPVVANRRYQLAIYTNTAGRPGTLVAASVTGTLVANSWNTLAISAPLLGSRTYWLMFNTNGRTASVNNMRYNTGAAGRGAYSTVSKPFGTWPATFPAVTTTNFVYSLFATF